MIKLKQGDFVDVRGMSDDDKHRIVRYFIKSGASAAFYLSLSDMMSWGGDNYIGWDHDGDCNGFDSAMILRHMGCTHEIDVDELLAQIYSEEPDKINVALEEIHKADNTAIACNRNVVFLDYDTVNGAGSLEITVTDDQEFNACFKGVGCVDSVEMNLDKEDFVELLKSWRKVINGAIEELKD